MLRSTHFVARSALSGYRRTGGITAVVLTVLVSLLHSLEPTVVRLPPVRLAAAEPGHLDRAYSGARRVLHFAGDRVARDAQYLQSTCTISPPELCGLANSYYEAGQLHVYSYASASHYELIFEATGGLIEQRPLSGQSYWDFIHRTEEQCDGARKYCYETSLSVGTPDYIIRTETATNIQTTIYEGDLPDHRIVVDGAGNVYFYHYISGSYQEILKLDLAGNLGVVGGGATSGRSSEYGIDPHGYDFENIQGFAFDTKGNLLVSQANIGLIVLVTGVGDMAPPVPDTQTFGPCDRDGAAASNPTTCRADPVNTATGAFTHHETDAQLYGAGDQFRFERFYSSADTISGPFGQGWAASYQASLSFPTSSTAVFRSETGQQIGFTKPGMEWIPAAGGRVSLAAVGGGGWEVKVRDGHRYRFDTAGRQTGLVDRNGVGVELTRDAAGKLTQAVDSANRTVTFTHNVAGQLTSMTLPDGRDVTYDYSNGRLVAVHQLNGGVTRYTYDGAGRLDSITDANNHQVIHNTYGANDRVTEQTDALEKISRFDWYPETQTSVLTDAANGLWVDDYDNNVLKRTINPMGDITTYSYDRDLNLIAVSQPPISSPPPSESIWDTLAWLATLQFLVTDPPPPGERATTFSYDAEGNLTSRRAPDPLGYTETWTYDANHQPLTYTDGRNKTTTWTYDGNGNRLSERRPGLPAANFIRDSAGRVTSATTARGHTTTFTYSPAGQPLTATDPLSGVTTWTYDSAGRTLTRTSPGGNQPGGVPADHRLTRTWTDDDRIATETLPTGATTTFHYDPAGNVTSVDHPGGGTTNYDYNTANERVAVTDPDGDTTTHSYDDRGLLVATTSPEGHRRTWTYDLARRPVTTVEPNGTAVGATPADHTWTYGYDAYGNLTTIEDPAGGTTTRRYDVLDRLVGTTDPAGRTTAMTYDAAGHVTALTDPAGSTTTFGYDDPGRVTSVTDPLGRTTSYGYDAADHVVSETTPLGYVTTRTYDQLDRPETTVTPAGNQTGANPATYRTTLTYDADGNVRSITEPGSAPTTFTHDGAGQVLTVTDPTNATTSYSYDPLGRLTSVIDALNHPTSFDHDLDGDLHSRTDAKNHTTTWAHDQDGLARTMTLPGGQAWTYDRDANGQITTVHSPKGTTIAYRYDRLGRIDHVNHSDTTPDVTYTYDPAGQIIGIDDGTGHRDLTYNTAGRLTGEQHDQTDALSYAYDAAGRLTEIGYPGGLRVTYGYDADGRLTTVTPNLADPTTYQYDANSNLTRIGYPNTYSDVRTYDPANRVTGITHSRGTQALNTIGYTRDPAGRPTRTTQTAGTPELYTYDPLGQVTDVCYADPCLASTPQIHWQYDAVGNRTQEQRPGSTSSYTYDLNDKLTSRVTGAATTTATHDPNGNLTAFGATTYAYDGADRLSTVTTPQTVLAYRYDDAGNRVGTATTNRLLGATTESSARWDTNRPIAQMVTEAAGGSAAPTASHLYGLGRIETLTGAQATYYLTDELGSVTTSTDANHTLFRNYGYEPFGAIRAATGSLVALDSPFGFTGEALDRTTGLYNLRARQLDPSTGRFLTTDPLPNGPATPDRSAYLYANNRPTTHTDPSGLREQELQQQSNELFECDTAMLGAYYDTFTFGFASRALNGFAHSIGRHPENQPGCGTIGATLGTAAGITLITAGIASRAGTLGRATSELEVAPQTARAVHASDLVESPLWTATKNRTSAQNAYRHFADHGADFPDIQNSVEYVGKAQNFLRTPPGGTLTRVRANGDVVRWHPNSNTFGVMDAGGAPRTFFRPDPSAHGHANNWDYFYAQ